MYCTSGGDYARHILRRPDGEGVRAAARQHGVSTTTAAAWQKRQHGERAVSASTAAANMQIPGMVIHGRGKYGLTNSESGDGRNGRHGHRGGGVAQSGNTSSP